MTGTSSDLPEPTRADFYREVADGIRARAATQTRSGEARRDLYSCAAGYDRLANYVESFWGSGRASGPSPPDQPRESDPR